jgi:hypothetical protein
MFEKLEIKLLKGFCSLSFGESKENVIKTFVIIIIKSTDYKNACAVRAFKKRTLML